MTSTVTDRLNDIRARIESACSAAGRHPSEVTLVAVSKTYGTDVIAEAIAAGQRCFGENRVQEAAEKFAALRTTTPGLELHIIGPLQTNKVRDAIAIANVIETLDRARLADALAAAAARGDALPRLLIQINVGEEPQKAGIAPAEADRFIAESQDRFGDCIAGLMCIPPADEDPRPYFMALAERAARHRLTTVSMGMSGDFELAIACGATHVRVGSAIFGARSAG